MKYKRSIYGKSEAGNAVKCQHAGNGTQEDRAKSPDLSAGVDEEAGIWEIIVKYTQDLSQFSAKYRVWKYMNYWVDMQL